MSKKDMPGDQGLPSDITLAVMQENWSIAESKYMKPVRRARILDAADKGKLWEAIKASFPKYQILPDTNHTSYVKSNLVASLYAMGKYSNILPSTKEDKDIVAKLNIAIENVWSTAQIGYYQMQAGDRAALLNVGITQVGWDNSIIGGTSDSTAWYKGDVVLKNIDPLKFRRDPYSPNLESSPWCHTWDNYHKTVILRNENYRDEFKKYLETNKSSSVSTSVPEKYGDVEDKQTGMTKDHYRIITHWIISAEDGETYEVHTVDNRHILQWKKIQPKGMLPFAELYCNDPQDEIFGASGPALIFNNSLAYNVMNSILLTAEYKNQRPPRFISTGSGLNLNTFKKYGNEADYTFVVNGDASRAVHYQQFPTPGPQIASMMAQLSMDVGKVSGVDERYTGRDTGSIITTGGIEDMLNQVTLIDQPKLNNYNRYAERLTMLVLTNMIEFGKKRSYFIKDPRKPKTYRTVEVDFPSIDSKTLFAYETDVSTDLPKNKARVAQMATVLMEKQLQYQAAGKQVEWITPEEWLMFQDIPNKEYLLERMNIQRDEDYVEMAAQIVFQYAELTQKGMPAEDALVATAESIRLDRQPGAAADQAAAQNAPTPQLGPVQQGMPPIA